jgi:hypothetical protein
VLPFQNLSGDATQDYFSDGITEDIITELSHFRSLFVIARNSSFSLRGRTADLGEIGRHLGVRYAVQGIVRKKLLGFYPATIGSEENRHRRGRADDDHRSGTLQRRCGHEFRRSMKRWRALMRLLEPFACPQFLGL